MTPDIEVVRSRVAFLGNLALFSGLPPADLRRLCGMSEEVRVPAGEVVFDEGALGDGLLVIVDGRLEVTKREGGQEVVLAHRGPGEVIGEMSLLGDVPRTATVRAVEDSTLLRIAPDEFQAMLRSSPSAATAILSTMAGRLRSTEALLMQREKLASLGTMAAGLAHELNNPAAAIQRSAAHLGKAFEAWEARSAELGGLTLSSEQADRLAALRREVESGGTAPADPLAASREEDALTGALEAMGVGTPWDIAPALAGAGFSVGRLRELAAGFEAAQLGTVVGWLAAGLEVRSLVREIGQSARLVSDLVRSVKSYAYLDQAPIQDVDLRGSLESTLMILRHRLKEGVRVSLDVAPDVPTIEAYGSELNQVWTNLIDNAVDAMHGEGSLDIQVRRAGDRVVVEVADDGEGIPEDLLPRIFEPFLTTKPPGQGSGLGLHIVYNIVTDHHGGRITAESRPGRTTFRVDLPVRSR